MSKFSYLKSNTSINIPSISDKDHPSKKNYFTNPILAGFYPDPSICRVGDKYYLVNSTFAYYPGITIFQSKDLVNWKLIGYALNRAGQLNLDSAGVSRGLFAPTIRYNDGIFYITCTLVDKGGNFVITSKKPTGPWSDPVWISVNGIDPSIFFDDSDKAYYLYNSVAPDNKPLYDGHRTIRMREFNIKNLKISNVEKIIVNGGTDISKKPIWIEGPHIFKKDNIYYLFCAEGGTAENHSEVVFRSKNVWGPYIPFDKNPILTQRNLNPDRKNPITCTGHADFVETPQGNWRAVFLGCRPYPPYEKDYYNTGRETFLAPVKWVEDSGKSWPIINPGREEVQYYYPNPLKPPKEKVDKQYSGNLTYKDDFNSSKLDINWMFLRTLRKKWYNLTEKKGFLAMKLRPETCSGEMNPSFMAYRQQNIYCTASTAIEFSTNAENEKAGLLIFQNETHFYFLCKSIEGNIPVVQLYKSGMDASLNELELLAYQKLNKDQNIKELDIKIEAKGGAYSFYYSFSRNHWLLLKNNVDGEFLSTKIAGGFVGCMFALYSTSLGKPSSNVAYFDWFQYKGGDTIYK